MAGLPEGFKDSKVGQKTNGAHTGRYYPLPNPAADIGNTHSSTENLQSRFWKSNVALNDNQHRKPKELNDNHGAN